VEGPPQRLRAVVAVLAGVAGVLELVMPKVPFKAELVVSVRA
jgi:hypothetical protein